MVNVKLKLHDVVHFMYEKKIVEDCKIELVPDMQYAVKYADDDSECRGDFIFEVKHDDGKNKVMLSFKSIGMFEIEKDTDEALSEAEKKQLHVESNNKLLPYWNAALAMMCNIANIPPMSLEKRDWNPDEIIYQDKKE